MTEEERDSIQEGDVVWVPMRVSHASRNPHTMYPVDLYNDACSLEEDVCIVCPERAELLRCKLERKSASCESP